MKQVEVKGKQLKCVVKATDTGAEGVFYKLCHRDQQRFLRFTTYPYATFEAGVEHARKYIKEVEDLSDAEVQETTL